MRLELPESLVMVRHGEVDPESDPRNWELTERGRRQARLAGEWVAREIGTDFDVAITSTNPRAQESADLMSLPVDWQANELADERDWGNYNELSDEDRRRLRHEGEWSQDRDPLHWSPPGGERLLDQMGRFRALIERLEGSERVLIVAHIGTFKSAHFVLEGLSVVEMAVWLRSGAPEDQINYGQVAERTRRRNPEDPESPLSDWFANRRSVWPGGPERNQPAEWHAIEPRTRYAMGMRRIIDEEYDLPGPTPTAKTRPKGKAWAIY